MNKRQMKEFSKRIIVAMTVLWFIGAVYGGVLVLRSGYGLESLLDYIGEPMRIGILAYLLKSGFENREKIKKTSEEEHP